MRSATKNISRFKLWRVTAANHETGGKLYRTLANMLEIISDYYEQKNSVEFLLPRQMSFVEALRFHCQRIGLKPMPMSEQRTLDWHVPIIARNKENDSPALLLPDGPEHYRELDTLTGKKKRINFPDVLKQYDEIIQIFLINDVPVLNHSAFAKKIGARSPIWIVIVQAISVFLLSMLFLFSGSLVLSHFGSINRWPLWTLLAITALILGSMMTADRFLKRNFGASFFSLIHDLYRRVFITGDQEFRQVNLDRIFEHILLIERSCAAFFKERFFLIAALLVTAGIIVAIMFASLPLAIGLAMVCVALGACAWLHYRAMQSVSQDISRDLGDLELYLERYQLSFPTVNSLKAFKPLMQQISEKQEIMFFNLLRYHLLLMIKNGLSFFLPLLLVIFFAVWGHAALPSLWQALGFVIAILLLGFMLGYVLHHIFQFSPVPADKAVARNLDNWVGSFDKRHVEPVNIQGNIEFINVSFSYQEAASSVFRNLNIAIEAQKLTAIYGKTGAGKTTFLKLCMGHIHQDIGEIVIDGQDVRSLDRQSLRRHFGVVFFESKLFAGSVFDNIMCGRTIESKTLEHLLLSHEIFDRLLDLPMGLETYIFWHRRNLSRLEMAIILLARALIHQPRVLFLDEPLFGLNARDQRIMLDFLGDLNITRIITSSTPLPSFTPDRIINI